jgi:hypothetical protein
MTVSFRSYYVRGELFALRLKFTYLCLGFSRANQSAFARCDRRSRGCGCTNLTTCNSLMSKFFYHAVLIIALLLAVPTRKAAADDDVVVGDTDDPNATSAKVTLAWDANSEDDIAGYNVYYGRASGHYSRVETVGVPTATITVRGRATVYFAVTAFNSAGVESDFSEEVHYP